MLLSLGAEVGHIDVAHFIALGHDHFHARHHGTGRIGAVGRCGDQRHLAMTLATAAVVLVDDHQPRIFALSARVRLERDGIEAGDLAQRLLQFIENGLVACGLIERHEWMDAGKLRQADRVQLAGGIQLHGAASERYHGMHERKVLVLQPLDVAHHVRLRMVGVERGVRQDGIGAEVL